MVLARLIHKAEKATDVNEAEVSEQIVATSPSIFLKPANDRKAGVSTEFGQKKSK